MVCGPTASGKSRLSDELADQISCAGGSWATTVVVDSMQVYREIPIITNQARERPAELVGTVSVSEEWTVARHRAATWDIAGQTQAPIILDAGTGMYLNAVLLDVPLAPKVAPEVRYQAEVAARELETPPSNLRRAVREEELRISGAPPRGSIWDRSLLFDAVILYLRPDWDPLRSAIGARSSDIARRGLQEARILDRMERAGSPPNPSVGISIGVRELRDHLRGDISIAEAEERIAARTRRLARRQIRWFDKLARTLQGKAHTLVVSTPDDPRIVHYMHDTMGL